MMRSDKTPPPDLIADKSARQSAAFDAWHKANMSYHGPVYGIALDTHGDWFYTWSADARTVRRVYGGGALARPATESELATLDYAMQNLSFMLVVKGVTIPYLRIWPALETEGWSRKSAHRFIGGAESCSAAVMIES